uniref:Genome polyprotein n=1 Tax=Wendell virus TaxID=2707281 RepID=A0A6H0DI99_9VIRU|nr:MAG: polyprotein [Wendell virus]
MKCHMDSHIFTTPQQRCFYCLPFVKRHEWHDGACRTCSNRWMMIRDKALPLGDPVYPLKADCIRGQKIQHGVNCQACSYWRDQYPCTLSMTSQIYDGNMLDLKVADRINGICYTCNVNHHVHPGLMDTACSSGDLPTRPRYYCLSGSRHSFCRWHSLSKNRQICCSCLNADVHRQGQGASHLTGNHTSRVNAGGNVTVVNYYGQNYNAANNPMSQTVDPEAVGSGVTSAVGAASNFIASPTVEEISGDSSDRIVQIIMGNSTLITQEAAAGAIVAWGQTPVYLEPQANTVDLPTRPGPSCDRFYTLPSFELTTSSGGWQIPFPGALANLGVFGTNLQYHYLYRAGAVIHVQCNTTQFHTGSLLVALVPECVVKPTGRGDDLYAKTSFFSVSEIGENGVALDDALGGDRITQLMIFPHQIINFRTNNSATILTPFMNVTPASCFVTHNIFRILIIPLTPLRPPPNTDQTIPITVSIAPVASQFNGLRNSDRQGLPVFQVPGSQEFMTTLPNDGMPAYPVWSAMPTFPQPGRVTNLLSVARIPTLLRIQNGDSIFGIAVTNKPTMNDNIYTFDLSVLANGFGSTYVSRLARMFGYYRGSIVLNLMFVGPKQSTGKLLVAYTPPGGRAPTSREDAMLGTSVVWDIGLQSTLTFPIPYISTSPYRYANRTGDTASFDGWLTIWYQTAILVAPGCAPTCDILVFAAAGEDFSLHCLMDTAYYQGPGDGIAGALQQAIGATITNAVANSLPALGNGPTQPSGESIQPGITQGHAPALEAAETGTATIANPSQIVAVEPGSVMQLSSEETAVSNLLSRYFQIAEVQMFDGNQVTGKCDLTLDAMMNAQPMLKTLLRAFTYFRSDLDLVFVTTATAAAELAIQVVFCPPGSFATAGEGVYRGVNPNVIFKVSGPPASMRIPFTSVAPYMALSYDGFSGFASGSGNTTGEYGACPANLFGTLLFKRMATGFALGGLRVLVFVRFVNPQVFIPRPLCSYKANAVTPTSSRGRLEVGDIENFIPPSTDNWDDLAVRQGSDPLPLEYPEGPSFAGVWLLGEFYPEPTTRDFVYSPYLREIAIRAPDFNIFMYHDTYCAISDIMSMDVLDAYEELTERYEALDWACGDNWILRRRLYTSMELLRVWLGFEDIDGGYFSDVERQGPLQSIGEGLAKGLHESFTTAFARVEEMRRDACNSWWKTVMGLVAKFVAVLVLVMRSRADPAILASVGTLISVDLINACPFVWIKTQLAELVGIKVPVRQGVSTFLKELNVAITAAKGLDWIVTKLMELVTWIKDTLVPASEEKVRLAEALADMPTILREWRSYQSDPSAYTEASALECAKKVLALRDLLEKEKPDSSTLRYNGPLFASAAKFIANTKHRTVEPMGVLIHGDPGTGKSLATKMIGTVMSRYYGSDIPYSLPPDPTYFDNYNGQPVVIMDDLGQNPDGGDMTLLCQMISAVDFITPQADLPDKGRPFTSKLVVASTNQRHLAPPTVTHPAALRRRFNLDLNINVFPAYAINGKLDVDKAFEKCNHSAVNFSSCCPFICGLAVSFVDRNTSEHLSLDKLVTDIKKLDAKRVTLASKVDAYLQGKVCKSTLKRVEGQIKRDGRRPLPDELRELIMADPAPGKPMLQYAYDLGYEIPDELTDGVALTETTTLVTHWKEIVAVIGAVAAVMTTAILIWRAIPTTEQGPYSGAVQRKLERPTRRTVEVQGPDPDTQFGTALLRHNIFSVDTATGSYTALGVYDNWVVLPSHAAVRPYYINGVEHVPEKEIDLVSRGMNLELTAVKFPTLQQFKDIRKFMVQSFLPVSDAVLLLNSSDLPRVAVNLRKVYNYGVLNLEGDATANVLYYQAPTKRGYCGGVVLKAGKIFGIHIAGDGVNGYCAALKPSYFANLEGVMSPPRKTATPVNVNRKTSFEPSVYHHLIEEKYGIQKQPAVLSQRDPRLQVDLDTALFSKYTGNVDVECPELEEAIEQYAAQLRVVLPFDVTEKLSLEQVVEGYGRLEGLDLATSAGFPYCRHGVTKRQLVADGYSKLIEGLDVHGYDLPFVTFLKDELRGNAKIPVGKTRVVEASSTNDTVRMKTVFGRFMEAMHSNPGTVTGMAVGCNPDRDWTRFATELGNGNVFSYDYTGYDASLSPGFFHALVKLFVKLGYDEKDVRPPLMHVCYSKHIYGQLEYDVEGGMCSGTSGTSIFNSLINNLIIKTLVLKAYKGIDLWQLKILAYGDDVLVDYPYPLDPEELAKLGGTLGLHITPADKGEVFKPPGPITEHTFLKRGFQPDQRYPFLYHPTFPKEEVYQSLAWTRDPRNMPEHVLSLAHLIWHNGEDDYSEFVALVRSVPVGRVVPIPSYKELLRAWYESF